MKKSPLKKKSGTSRLKLRMKADKLWSEVIRSRTKNKCEVCGKGPVQAHHIVTREVYHLRHQLNNGVALCYTHHVGSPRVSAHQSPEWFRTWLIETRGQEWYDDLQADSRRHIKPDYESEIAFLESFLKEDQWLN